MVNEHLNPKVGDKVKPLLGPYQGQVLTVKEIKFNAGAPNGWFTCQAADGETPMFTGEELIYE